MSLSTIILLALAIGAGFGAALHEWFPLWIIPLNHYLLAPLGQAFLRLIQFVVVPIVFSALIMGLTRIQNAAEMGRYTAKLLFSYLVSSVIAVAVGLATAIVLQPGVGLTGLAQTQVEMTGKAPDLINWLVELIPTNPLMALSTSNLLQTIISGALIGLGIQRSGVKAEPFIAFIESVYVISEKILYLILYLAPVGVFALMASVIAEQGVGILLRLLTYMIGVLTQSPAAKVFQEFLSQFISCFWYGEF